MTVRYHETNPCSVVFQPKGSVWFDVLPYCLLNCLITYVVRLAQKHDIPLSFSPQGHALVGLLVSFLVINKVYLALDRYMQARTAIGQALANLRVLHQMALLFTSSSLREELKDSEHQPWRDAVASKVIGLLDCMINTIRDDDKTARLSRNECEAIKGGIDKNADKDDDDPMVHAMALRHHLYTGVDLELMEKMKLLDQLALVMNYYQDLLKIASTPLPFPMVQMARTFVFLWIFTMPLIFHGLELAVSAVMGFILFLTYGYIGLELVARDLLSPFGDRINDLNVLGMREATVIGIEQDAKMARGQATINRKSSTRQRYSASNNNQVVDVESPYRPLEGNHEVSQGYTMGLH